MFAVYVSCRRLDLVETIRVLFGYFEDKHKAESLIQQ